jgi:hypothetical protein
MAERNMKLSNIYLILVAITLVAAVVFSPDPRKEDHAYEIPVRIACW